MHYYYPNAIIVTNSSKSFADDIKSVRAKISIFIIFSNHSFMLHRERERLFHFNFTFTLLAFRNVILCFHIPALIESRLKYDVANIQCIHIKILIFDRDWLSLHESCMFGKEKYSYWRYDESICAFNFDWHIPGKFRKYSPLLLCVCMCCPTTGVRRPFQWHIYFIWHGLWLWMNRNQKAIASVGIGKWIKIKNMPFSADRSHCLFDFCVIYSVSCLLGGMACLHEITKTHQQYYNMRKFNSPVRNYMCSFFHAQHKNVAAYLLLFVCALL